MNYTFENFITFCDTLTIATEASVPERRPVNDADRSCYRSFCEYLNNHNTEPSLSSIKPLPEPMIENSKKNGTYVLLATYDGNLKRSDIDKIKKDFSENVLYDNQKIEYGTCYFGGDIFVVGMTEKKTE